MFRTVRILWQSVPIFWWPLALWYVLRLRTTLLIFYWRNRWAGASDAEAREWVVSVVEDALVELNIK